MPTRLVLMTVALGLLLSAGCGPAKLNETKTLSLDKETMARAVDLDSQSKAQTITVEFSSSEGEVFVGVFKKDDIKDDEAMATVGKEKALGSKKSKGETFTVDVPENTATRVVVRDHKTKTDVTLKITNAK
jgi:hypothetical protein